MNARLFGTDGIRGKPGEGALAEENLERLGRLLGGRLQPAAGAQAPRVLIGHDGRESGETLAAALSRGLVRSGAGVDMLGLAPTPAVAYLVATEGYSGGVVVSASHNPAGDNGVKLLGSDGAKLPDPDEEAIEAALVAREELPDAARPGEMRRTKGLASGYVGWMRSDAFPDLELPGWRILMDCANGAFSEIGPRTLRAFGADVDPLHDRPDGRNINAGCGTLHPESAIEAMRGGDYHVGLVVDGDGDRGMLIDADGRLLDGDALLAGLGAHLAARNRLPRNTVVATVMSNMGLDRFLARAQVEVERVAVGDRQVVTAMRRGGFGLGGEKSGHLLFGEEHGFRGDGLYTFLKAAQAMHAAGVTARQFAAGFTELPQRLVNLPVSRRAPLDQLPLLAQALREVQAALDGRGRAVVRFSGTEQVLRLMAEAESAAEIEAALEKLQAAAEADGILA